MHAFKIEHFERDHPGDRYPPVSTLPSDETAPLIERMTPLFSRAYHSDPLSGMDANLEEFNLGNAWGETILSPAE